MIGYRFYQKVYNRTIRPYLPTKYRLLAGVAVQDTPLFDFSADEPEYKRGLMKAIKQGVNEGDEVELIGFGRGVSAVRTFDEGARHIIAYEAAEEMIKLGKKTIKNNRPCDCNISIQQSIIGNPKDIYGDASDADIKPLSRLCESDVLILDCEGSEKSILEGLDMYPNTIICETHPEHGISNQEIIEILEQNTYDTTRYEYEPGSKEKKVILAEKY